MTRDFLNEISRQENEERELHNIPAEELHVGGNIHRNFFCNFQYQDIRVLYLPNGSSSSSKENYGVAFSEFGFMWLC